MWSSAPIGAEPIGSEELESSGPSSTAYVSAVGDLLRSGSAGISADVLPMLPAVSVSVSATGAMLRSGTASIAVADPAEIWPSDPAGPSHRAIVPFYGVQAIVPFTGVRAIVTAETIEA